MLDARRSSASSASETLREMLRPKKPRAMMAKQEFTITIDEAVELLAAHRNCRMCRPYHPCRDFHCARALKLLASEVVDFSRDLPSHCRLSDLAAIRSLPVQLSLCLSGVADGHIGVCNRSGRLQPEQWFGPYRGKQIGHADVYQMPVSQDEYLWEIFEGRRISHYLDGSDPNVANWMRFVRCAPTQRDASMLAIQFEREIHYQVTRPVDAGEELTVWYAPDCYHSVHGVPAGLKTHTYDRRRGSEPKLHRPTHIAVATATTPVLEYRAQSMYTVAAPPPHHHGTMIGAARAPPPGQHVVMVQQPDPSGGGLIVTPAPQLQAAPTQYIVHHQPPPPPQGIPVGYPAPPGQPMPPGAERMQLAVARGGLDMSRRHCHRWECSQCEEVFGQRLNMEKHVCRCGEIEKPYRCMMCGMGFSNGQFLQGHVSNECPRAVEGPQEKPYACEYCRKPFTGTTTLMNHIRTHYEGQSKRCEQCSEEFKTFALLNRHVCKAQNANANAAAVANAADVANDGEEDSEDDSSSGSEAGDEEEGVQAADPRHIKHSPMDTGGRRSSDSGGDTRHSATSSSHTDSSQHQHHQQQQQPFLAPSAHARYHPAAPVVSGQHHTSPGSHHHHQHHHHHHRQQHHADAIANASTGIPMHSPPAHVSLALHGPPPPPPPTHTAAAAAAGTGEQSHMHASSQQHAMHSPPAAEAHGPATTTPTTTAAAAAAAAVGYRAVAAPPAHSYHHPQYGSAQQQHPPHLHHQAHMQGHSQALAHIRDEASSSSTSGSSSGSNSDRGTPGNASSSYDDQPTS